jgi:aspartate/methionine/tyrosine aminotransferase
MPGERLGYLVSSNREFLEFAQYNLLSQRDCPSNLNAGMICLDAVLRAAEYLIKEQGYSKLAATSLVKSTFSEVLPTISMPINEALVGIYLQQREEDQNAYRENFNSTIRFGIDSGIITEISDGNSAYNCLVKLDKVPQNMSYFELAVNLFLNYGLETQWGANFDNNYSRWDREYGPWMRLTFSSDSKYLIDGLKRIQQGLELFAQDGYPLFRTDLFKSGGK